MYILLIHVFKLITVIMLQLVLYYYSHPLAYSLRDSPHKKLYAYCNVRKSTRRIMITSNIGLSKWLHKYKYKYCTVLQLN